MIIKDEERLFKAFSYATEKHREQRRKGGLLYVTHPIAVAEMLLMKNYPTDYIITALFHDLLEDTDASEKDILLIGGPTVLENVKVLTKKPGYNMKEYVDAIKAHPIAYAVKGADRLHNLRSAKTAGKDFIKKYIKETEEWYMDFDPEIPKAVEELKKYLENTNG